MWQRTTQRGLKADRTREGEAREPYGALQGQKRPPPGTRPGVLPDPGSKLGVVTVGYVAAPVLHLSPPVLAGGDGLDGAALHFLVQQAVLAQRLEEEVAVVQLNEGRRKEALQAAKEAKERVELVDGDTGKTFFYNARRSSRRRKRR